MNCEKFVVLYFVASHSYSEDDTLVRKLVSQKMGNIALLTLGKNLFLLILYRFCQIKIEEVGGFIDFLNLICS